MGIIIRLPYKLILTFGLIIVFGHNVFDFIPNTHQGFFWDLIRNGNFTFHQIGSHQLVIIYPFVPWLGLMMLGYSIGKIYEPSIGISQRKKILVKSGCGLLLIFAVLRFINIYGNPIAWFVQSTSLFTFLSFINVHKYPPSLLFMCMTIGPALLFLSFFENTNNKLSKAVSIYGRVPFFYYVIHFYTLHILCMILFVIRGHSISEVTPDIWGIPFRFMIAGEGYSLTIVYLIWATLVLAMYPLCKWFSELKRRSTIWWLSYL